MSVMYGSRNYENFVKVIRNTLRDLNSAKNILINNKKEELSLEESYAFIALLSKRVRPHSMFFAAAKHKNHLKLDNMKNFSVIYNKFYTVLKGIRDGKLSLEDFEKAYQDSFTRGIFSSLVKAYPISAIDNLISLVKEDAKLHIENAKVGMKNTLAILNNNDADMFEKQDAWEELPHKEKRLKTMEKVEKLLEKNQDF